MKNKKFFKIMSKFKNNLLNYKVTTICKNKLLSKSYIVQKVQMKNLKIK